MPASHDNVFNVFRILGDLTHLLSKVVLIWAIHSNKSAEGVSLITQALYAAVFSTRYLDLLRPSSYTGGHFILWNFLFKIFYIASSLYIVFVMMRVYSRSREREKAWKFGAFCLAGSLVAAPFVMMIFQNKKSWGFFNFLWVFSEILESVCVLPQLLLLRQTTVPTVIDSFYLVLLGSYRVFYILNWIVRGASKEHHFDAVSTIFGVTQVLFYIDFAWVYWTRQRVKLRNGMVVDQDDMSRGYLVGKFLGRYSSDAAREGEEGNSRGWAGRGISISADEETVGSRPQPKRFNDAAARDEERSSMMHGEQEEVDFDDEAGGQASRTAADSGVTGGEEWLGTSDDK